MFAVMILLGGLVVIINAWSVIDTRAALDAATREYLRTYTSGPDQHSARTDAELAAIGVLTGRGTAFDTPRFELDRPNGFGPCAAVTVSLSIRVPTLRAPFLEPFGRTRSASVLTGLVDAHRQIVSDDRYDPFRTECFGD